MKITNSILAIIFCCIYSMGHTQNAPLTNAPIISSCSGSSIDVPITVSDFNDIGAISLTLHFNSSAFTYNSFTNNSGFPGLAAYNPNPGVITAAGFSVSDGISLPDNSILLTIHFNSLGENSNLNWFDDGTSCEYAGPPPTYIVLNDEPQNSFYIDGSVNEIPAPFITEQPVSPDTVQAGAGTAIFNVLATGQNLTYQWQEYISSWEDISEGGVYEGAVSSTLNIVNPPINMNGYNYRCTVSGSCDPPAITDGLAVLTVINITNIKVHIENPEIHNKITINAYPNPFSKRVVLNYYLPLAGEFFIEIFDFKGNSARTVIKSNETKGNHTLNLSLNYLKTGIYTVQLQLRSDIGVLSKSIKIAHKE